MSTRIFPVKRRKAPPEIPPIRDWQDAIKFVRLWGEVRAISDDVRSVEALKK